MTLDNAKEMVSEALKDPCPDDIPDELFVAIMTLRHGKAQGDDEALVLYRRACDWATDEHDLPDPDDPDFIVPDFPPES
jgi:hypothetical protein